MGATLGVCGWLVAPSIGVVELAEIAILSYLLVSAMVSVSEIEVVEEGLLVKRLILPKRFLPWSSINRVIVYRRRNSTLNARMEIASIGFYEGLSPLNRLSGPMYGQGMQQTIMISPDAVDGYDQLLLWLEQHCSVIRREAGSWEYE